MTAQIPHLRVVVTVTFFVLIVFACVTAGVLISGDVDAATKGSIIEAWKNFALLGVGFWLGSSSGGKQQATEPQPVAVVNPPDAPVPVEPARDAAELAQQFKDARND